MTPRRLQLDKTRGESCGVSPHHTPEKKTGSLGPTFGHIVRKFVHAPITAVLSAAHVRTWLDMAHMGWCSLPPPPLLSGRPPSRTPNNKDNKGRVTIRGAHGKMQPQKTFHWSSPTRGWHCTLIPLQLDDPRPWCCDETPPQIVYHRVGVNMANEPGRKWKSPWKKK